MIKNSNKIAIVYIKLSLLVIACCNVRKVIRSLFAIGLLMIYWIYFKSYFMKMKSNKPIFCDLITLFIIYIRGWNYFITLMVVPSLLRMICTPRLLELIRCPAVL